MSRQHALPILIGEETTTPLSPLGLAAQDGQISEDFLQDLIHRHPECIPVSEIDPIFKGLVPICRELATPAGYVDNLLITPSGLPALVECKLWRNPQARREVVGQIIDYAKELARWTYSDLQREVSKRTGRTGNALLEIMRESGHEIDEADFSDAVTANLRRGRFLLAVVGDGIRDGVESIAEYLQVNAGLHFTFGLIELPIFSTPSGERLVIPRVLARTALVHRSVVAVPEGHRLTEEASDSEETPEDQDPVGRVAFWRDFVAGLELDDPEQPKPNPGRQGYVTLSMPIPGGNGWLVVYRSEPNWEVGVYFSFAVETIGSRVNDQLLEDWTEIESELGGTVQASADRRGRVLISDAVRTGSWAVPEERMKAFEWLRARTNDFVNVLRPRIRAIVDDLGEA